LSGARRIVRWLSNACGFIAVVCLAAACVVVCQMVFVRYVLESSTIWQTEFVLYGVVAATLIGSPYVLATHGHVKVDLLSQLLPPAAGRALRAVAALLGIAFCVVLAWSGWRYFYEAWTEGWVTESVWAPPLWIVLAPLPLGIGVLTLQYVVELIEIATGRDAASSIEAAAGMPE
jgi:TRAP-type C4-dicarboxylate transport system permease small subunit